MKRIAVLVSLPLLSTVLTVAQEPVVTQADNASIVGTSQKGIRKSSKTTTPTYPIAADVYTTLDTTVVPRHVRHYRMDAIAVSGL